MVSEKKIEEIASKIAEGFNPEKIILFGSYALGNPNRNSDLDFLIVKNSDLPVHRRANDIRMALIGTTTPMDILVYTPTEFETEKSIERSFLNMLLKSSKILYDQSKP